MKSLFLQSSISKGFDRSDKLIAQLTNDLFPEAQADRILRAIEKPMVIDDKVSRIMDCLDRSL